MALYDFEMPWPPTVNHYHQPVRMGRGVRIIKGQKAAEYDCHARIALDEQGLVNEEVEGRLSVSLKLHPPTARRYDIDNRTKAVFDSLSKACFWGDDEQVDHLVIRKGEKVKGGKVVVSVDIL